MESSTPTYNLSGSTFLHSKSALENNVDVALPTSLVTCARRLLGAKQPLHIMFGGENVAHSNKT